ncbi:MAG TPA: hypothetical protein VFU11_06015 [Solirubrobacterales bacterium]|nr:hypothetical protein [Solirubrobacterales bacterium]
MTPWKIPLVVAAIAVPIAAAFLTVGPALGMAAGAMAAVAIVAVAARQQPRGEIGPPDYAGEQRVLIVVDAPLEDLAAIEEVAAVVRTKAASEVMVLAPARIGFLDRWASDVEEARGDAQRRLVISVASLAAAGVEAEARVGDEDVVQAVEDQLGSFPASEVILVSAVGEEDPAAVAAAEELRSRLRAGFRWVLSGPATR